MSQALLTNRFTKPQMIWSPTDVLMTVMQAANDSPVNASLAGMAQAPAPPAAGPCCCSRPISVPIAAYVVDIGVTLGLLLICSIFLRCVLMEVACML
jgi:hypothetical protein